MSQQTNVIREVLTALKEDQATFSAFGPRVAACDKGLAALAELEAAKEAESEKPKRRARKWQG
jgi:hypothetical protein